MLVRVETLRRNVCKIACWSELRRCDVMYVRLCVGQVKVETLRRNVCKIACWSELRRWDVMYVRLRVGQS